MKTPTKTTVTGGLNEDAEDVGKLAVKYTARTGHRILAACWGYDGRPNERPIAVVIGQ